VFRPHMPEAERKRLLGQWSRAVEHSFGWVEA